MIPKPMRDLKNWVLIGNKVPYDPNTYEKHAEVYSNYNPETWGTYEDCKTKLEKHKSEHFTIFDHLGFALGGNNNIICIDIDRGINDDGAPNKLALQIIKKFNSYTEWSMHKRGFHIFVKGHIPEDKYHTKNYGIEICSKGWVYTMTEDAYLDVPLIENQKAIDWLLNKYFDTEKDIETIRENRHDLHQKQNK